MPQWLEKASITSRHTLLRLKRVEDLEKYYPKTYIIKAKRSSFSGEAYTTAYRIY